MFEGGKKPTPFFCAMCISLFSRIKISRKLLTLKTYFIIIYRGNDFLFNAILLFILGNILVHFIKTQKPRKSRQDPTVKSKKKKVNLPLIIFNYN